MKIMIFKYKTEKHVNIERYYPDNELAQLFLALNQARGAKTFTKEHLAVIKKIGELLDFEVQEIKNPLQ